MHHSAQQFASTALEAHEVAGKYVIEAGAMDVNGSARSAIEAHGPESYIATDIQAGQGVDEVCAAEELPERFGEDAADIVISTEMLEHARDWRAAMDGMIRVLAPGGVLVLTTRSEGFPYHGYPDDHWRFSVPAMRQILDAAGLADIQVGPDPDPASPGVFARARKPRRWQRPHGLAEAWAGADVTPAPRG